MCLTSFHHPSTPNPLKNKWVCFSRTTQKSAGLGFSRTRVGNHWPKIPEESHYVFGHWCFPQNEFHFNKKRIIIALIKAQKICTADTEFLFSFCLCHMFNLCLYSQSEVYVTLPGRWAALKDVLLQLSFCSPRHEMLLVPHISNPHVIPVQVSWMQ